MLVSALVCIVLYLLTVLTLTIALLGLAIACVSGDDRWFFCEIALVPATIFWVRWVRKYFD